MKQHRLQQLVRIALFTTFIVVGTVVLPPIYILSIPVTLQTFFVMLTGLLLPPKDAFLALLLYLLIGIIGIPVFSGYTSGFGALLGPTGGFLLSFPIAAFLISLMKRDHHRFLTTLGNCLLFGVVIVYLIAVPLFSYHLNIGLVDGFKAMGAFTVIDTGKAILAVVIAERFKEHLKAREG